jgi:hypothetical protein
MQVQPPDRAVVTIFEQSPALFCAIQPYLLRHDFRVTEIIISGTIGLLSCRNTVFTSAIKQIGIKKRVKVKNASRKRNNLRKRHLKIPGLRCFTLHDTPFNETKANDFPNSI